MDKKKAFKSSSSKNTISGKSTSSGKSTTSSKSRERRLARIQGPAVLTPVSRDKQKKIFTWDTMHNVDAGIAFELVYGFKADVAFTNDYGKLINKSNAREWWERASATTQCNNVIGQFQPNVTPCYICGLTIESNAECEHILPVFSAAMYLSLYRSGFKEIFDKVKRGQALTTEEQNIYTELNLEYAWSHRCCNQKKSSINFVKYKIQRASTGTFELDYKNTFDVLDSIVKSSIAGNTEICKEANLSTFFKKMNKTQITKWIKGRIDILNANPNGKVRDIVNYLNSKGNAFNNEMFILLNLCSLISAADMDEIYATWQQISGVPIPIKETPPMDQMTKSIAINNVSQLINQNFQFNWGARTRTQLIEELYRIVISIPDGIKFNNIGRNNTNINFLPAILGTLLSLNKENENINDFFRNFYAVITQNKIIDDDAYASNLVGLCFEILFLEIAIRNIKTSPLFIENSQDATFMQFLEQFNSKSISTITTLLELLDKYTKQDQYQQFRIDIFFYFIKLFTYFVNQVDTGVTMSNSLIQKILQILGSDIAFSPDQLNALSQINDYSSIQNYINNIENSVINYYMNDAEYLKFFPTWSPDSPDPDDTELTTSAKDVAVGATGLIKLLNENPSEDQVVEIGSAIGKGPLQTEIKSLCQSYPDVCQFMGNIDINSLNETNLTELLVTIDKNIYLNYISQLCSGNNTEFCVDIITNYVNITYPNLIISSGNLQEILNTKMNNIDLKNIVNAINDIDSLPDDCTPGSPGCILSGGNRSKKTRKKKHKKTKITKKNINKKKTRKKKNTRKKKKNTIKKNTNKRLTKPVKK